MTTPAYTQAAYRFYEDGTESGSTATAAQDTAITRDLSGGDSNLQIRIRLQNTNASSSGAGINFQLQRAVLRPNGISPNTGWITVGTATNAIKGFDSGSLTEDQATTNRLGAGSGSFDAGNVSEDGVATDTGGTAASAYTEFMFSVTLVAADLGDGDVVTFRMLRNGATLATYSVTPTITISKTANVNFGDLKGILRAGAISVTNPSSPTGSVSVALSDLVYVHMAEQTALSAGTVNDNLGNTYTAVNVGSDDGNATGRAYYSVVTTAGTLTQVNIAATASGDNYAAVACVFKGPFRSSPLDANPANALSDTASPIDCPATGTLTQADELVIGALALATFAYATGTGAPTTFGTTSPMRFITTQSDTTGSVIASIIMAQTVAATTTITPSFSFAGISTPASMVGITASFKKDTGGAYTHTAAQGSYALTGQAATLRQGHLLTAAASSYAISGQAATLRQGHAVSASATSYAISGKAAGLSFVGQQLLGGGYSPFGSIPWGGSPTVVVAAAYTLTADAGSYSISGQAASLLRGYKVIANAGAYSITGVDAALRKSRIHVAAPGSYLITGQAMAFRKSRILVAAPGSYTISGQAASLLQTQLISALTGTYSISGKAAGVLKGSLITANAGSYTITGQVANFVRGYKITANAGSYAVSGQDATLFKSRIISANAGSYSISGQAAAIVYTPVGAYVIGALAGSYSVSGQAANLLHGSVIVANAGSYAITGQAATLLKSRILRADPGAYTIAGQAVTLFRGVRILAASTTGYSLDGVAANINYAASRIIAANAGSYSISGQAAGVLSTKLITANAGSYAINGQQAILTKSKVLTALAGSYGLSGKAAILLKTKILAAQNGSYAINGQAAAIMVAGNKVLLANSGSYSISGKAAAFLYGGIVTGGQVLGGGYHWPFGSAPFGGIATMPVGIYVIHALSGTYIVTGNAAAVRHIRVLANTGSYTVGGQAATFAYGRQFVANSGTYSVSGKDVGLYYQPFLFPKSYATIIGV